MFKTLWIPGYPVGQLSVIEILLKISDSVVPILFKARTRVDLSHDQAREVQSVPQKVQLQ